MLHHVFHNGQAGGDSGYGRAETEELVTCNFIIKPSADYDMKLSKRVYSPEEKARRAELRIAAALQGTPGRIGAALQGTPGNQGTPEDLLSTSILPRTARACKEDAREEEDKVHTPEENDDRPEAGAGPSPSDIWSEDSLPLMNDPPEPGEHPYRRCTWTECSGDCRCDWGDGNPERTPESDLARCSDVSDPFGLCTWTECYDECTCRRRSRSEGALAVTTGTRTQEMAEVTTGTRAHEMARWF